VLLEVSNLSVEIPVVDGVLRALRAVSFAVVPGETVCLVGESGSGKSLTALGLMGLLPATARRSADSLTFLGLDLQSMPERRLRQLRGAEMAMIFQEPMTSLNPVFTVGRQLIDVYRHHKGYSSAEARERALYLLTRTGVDSARERLSQFPHELSGGLRQRVMIAMALMCGPKLIIADEPTTALDVTVQADLLRLLVDLQQEFGMAMLFISHDLGVVSRIADRIAVMYAGEIVEMAAAAGVLSSPSHPYTQGLIACTPEARHHKRRRLSTIPGMMPSPIGEPRGCLFRERCLHAHARCEAGVSLTMTEPGHHVRCVLACETDERARTGAFES
jgi:peptide/nickel transport system ATP-binding protein